MSLYAKRGVSAQKEEVHAATKNVSKGLYEKAFCKILPDILGGEENWVNVMHADGAGTKSILAYLYWKETGDVSVWKGIAQDAIVMNLDDLLCVGVYDHILFSSSIDRNKARIPVEVLQAIIEGTQEFFELLKKHGINIHFSGGETADVGDVVRTIAVNGTMTARWPKEKTITNEKIGPGQFIVGLASYGQSTYENGYNSGIGSNGLTSARHDMLSKKYKLNYPETVEETLEDAIIYNGKYAVTDELSVTYNGDVFNCPVGKLLLSPTRTFAPVIKEVLQNNFYDVYGLIHCSGGGQTKGMKYVPQNVRIIKDSLFDVPPVFRLIQQSSGADDREMYQVFNMGCRFELYTNENGADKIISIARHYGVEAQVIGRVEEATQKELVIKRGDAKIVY